MTVYKPPHHRSPRTRCSLQYEHTQGNTTMYNTTLTAEKIEDYTVMLCDALYMNFKEYQIRAHKRSIANDINMDYHQSKIDDIMENGADMEFYVKKGKRYLKIIMKDSGGSTVLTLSLIVRQAMYIRQHLGKHLPRLLVSLFCRTVIVSGCTSTLTGLVVIFISDETNKR